MLIVLPKLPWFGSMVQCRSPLAEFLPCPIGARIMWSESSYRRKCSKPVEWNAALIALHDRKNIGEHSHFKPAMNSSFVNVVWSEYSAYGLKKVSSILLYMISMWFLCKTILQRGKCEWPDKGKI